ncbi:MAG: hypothetical protein KTR14_07835 [Vampirovibrio sp.]|nr:hypothetical protein [Vampirovibrio sp.]
MHIEPTHKNKRFYDQEPTLSRAVNVMLMFPKEIQQIIVEGMIDLADQEYRASEILNNVRTLGRDKVLALYKSKQKKRDFDNDPMTHKLMNYMMILSDENRILMSNHILELVESVQEYLVTCKNYHENPDAEQIQGLTNTYVADGKEAANQVMSGIKKAFMEKVAGQPAAPPVKTPTSDPKGLNKKAQPLQAPTSKGERIVADPTGAKGGDMRIKGDP